MSAGGGASGVLSGAPGIGSRASSPEMHTKPRVPQEWNATGAGTAPVTGTTGAKPVYTAVSSTPGGGGNGNGSVGATPARVQRRGSGSPNNLTDSPEGNGGGGAMLSIANPGLVASTVAAPMSASKINSTNPQSFRGRGGAFGMLLHKVQATQPSSVGVGSKADAPGVGDGVGVEGGDEGQL